jgi:UDP-N-acetylmuramyl pentapeptide phosphotransferase/UDP-N-acetylglucosamine-1-phosphate transferase
MSPAIDLAAWRQRPELALTALALISGLLSATVGLDRELAWLRPVAAVFFLDAGAVPIGAFYAAAMASGLWLATSNRLTLMALPVVVMYAWSAAIQVGIRLQRTADDDPHLIAAGLLSGLTGAAITHLGCGYFVPELRRAGRIAVTCAVGAVAGMLLYLGQRQVVDIRVLFVVWQPAVAYCIGRGLTRPVQGASSNERGS